MNSISNESAFSDAFISPNQRSLIEIDRALHAANTLVQAWARSTHTPYSGKDFSSIEQAMQSEDLLPEQGVSPEALQSWLSDQVMADSIAVSHPKTMAHLHCPPTISSLLAESVCTALNQSMDSWDQASSATYVEQAFIQQLVRKFGYGPEGDGVFTSGGTQSNLMGLLLAREFSFKAALGWSVQERGLPDLQLHKPVVICSEVAHFSVQKSAAILGLGFDAVLRVPCDELKRMKPDALLQTLEECKSQGRIVIAVVATAGTTDFGSVDPLRDVCEVAHRFNAWVHVDAAYGGAAVFSDKYAHILDGIECADSITVDFHKLFFQPISASALLVKRSQDWSAIRYNADYLNPEENEAVGVLDLVGKSIQTTRRFDGLKLAVLFKSVGTRMFGQWLDHLFDLAQALGTHIESDPDLKMMARPSLVSVVFRFEQSGLIEHTTEQVNKSARKKLLDSGRGHIGMTRVEGRYSVKFTLMNPLTQFSDALEVMADFKQFARQALSELGQPYSS